MSVSQFESAIKNNMDNYTDTLKSLRNSEVLQRNSALSGLQSSMEKYGELAKLGLEIPVAVEGLKQVGGNAYDRVNRIRDFVKGKKDALLSAKQSIKTALSTSNPKITNPTSLTTKPSIPKTALNSDVETKTANIVSQDETAEGSKMANYKMFGRKTVGNFVENQNVEMTQAQARQTMFKRGPGFEAQQISTRGSINAPTDSESNLIQKTSTKGSINAPTDSKSNLIQNATQAEGESKVVPTITKDLTTKSNTITKDLPTKSDVPSVAKDLTPITEEEIGGSLFSIPGIGEVLGGIMEGIGAITEATAVGAGAYGAVQSMMAGDKEEALRDTPLAPIRMPTLDLGGSIGVPLMA